MPYHVFCDLFHNSWVLSKQRLTSLNSRRSYIFSLKLSLPPHPQGSHVLKSLLMRCWILCIEILISYLFLFISLYCFQKKIFYLSFLLFNWTLTVRCDIFLLTFWEFCLFSGYSVKNSILFLKNVSPIQSTNFLKTALPSSVSPTTCLCVH